MQIFQATLTYQVVYFQASDRLTTPRQMLRYLTAGVPESGEESFWLLAMNPRRRPICRQQLATGALVTARVNVSKVFLAIALAEAKAFTCLRLHSGVSLNLRGATNDSSGSWRKWPGFAGWNSSTTSWHASTISTAALGETVPALSHERYAP